MAIFSGKIIEAYFTNSENNAVEVIYNDGTRAVSHYIKVDFKDNDFKELISEYDTDKIAESTIARNRKYAQQISDLIDAGIKTKTDTKHKISVEEFVKKILHFDANDEEAKEILFSMKIEAFEGGKLKDCKDNKLLERLRSAKTPIDFLATYNEIDD